MAVAEVHGGIRSQHVHVSLAVHVSDPHALGAGHHHRQRVVIVRGEPLDQLDLLSPRHFLSRSFGLYDHGFLFLSCQLN